MFWIFFYYFCFHVVVGSWILFEAIFKSRYPLTMEEFKEQPYDWIDFFACFLLVWPFFVYLGVRAWMRGE